MASPVKKSTKAPVKKATGPKTIDILVEAIKTLDDPKGASIQAIKTYVLTQYPEKDPNFIKTSLKKAIQKGFDDELLVRPKKSEIAGASLSGRLKLNKVKIAQNEKVAKAKTKVAEKKAAKKEKTVKPKEGATKKKSTTVKKSPKKKTTEKATKAKTTKKSPAKKKDTKTKPKAKTPEKAKKTTTKTPKKVTKTPMKTTKGKAKA